MLRKISYNTFDKVTFIISFLLLIWATFFFLIDEYKLVTVGLIIVNTFFLVKFYRFPSLFLFFFFVLLHSLVYYDFFILEKSISFWEDFQDKTNISVSLYSYFLFIFFIGNVISSFELKNSKKFNFKDIFPGNKLVFTSLYILALLIIIYSIGGENIIESGAYASGDNFKLPIFEYFILIYFLLIIYVKTSLFNHFAMACLFVFYVIKSFLYGGRIEVVQLCLLLFFVLIELRTNVNTVRLLLLLITVLYLNHVFGVIRSNPLLLYDSNILELFDPFTQFKGNDQMNFKSTTEGDVVQSSARMVGLVNNHEITFGERVKGFIFFVFSAFIPGSYIPDYVSLASYKQSIYKSGGGGLISSYFYVWFGYIGPVIIGLLLGLLINIFFMYRHKSKTIFIYGFCLLATFPRWHSYSPILLVKFSVYAIGFYLIICYILNLLTVKFSNNLK